MSDLEVEQLSQGLKASVAAVDPVPPDLRRLDARAVGRRTRRRLMLTGVAGAGLLALTGAVLAWAPAPAQHTSRLGSGPVTPCRPADFHYTFSWSRDGEQTVGQLTASYSGAATCALVASPQVEPLDAAGEPLPLMEALFQGQHDYIPQISHGDVVQSQIFWTNYCDTKAPGTTVLINLHGAPREAVVAETTKPPTPSCVEPDRASRIAARNFQMK